MSTKNQVDTIIGQRAPGWNVVPPDAHGWLDEEREPAGMSPGEQQFLALALKTYRETNSDGRKRLKQLLKSFEG